jgi:hypothetical protein
MMGLHLSFIGCGMQACGAREGDEGGFMMAPQPPDGCRVTYDVLRSHMFAILKEGAERGQGEPSHTKTYDFIRPY